jgi:hypothetical protein
MKSSIILKAFISIFSHIFLNPMVRVRINYYMAEENKQTREATVTSAYETKRAADISARQAGLITDDMYHDSE